MFSLIWVALASAIPFFPSFLPLRPFAPAPASIRIRDYDCSHRPAPLLSHTHLTYLIDFLNKFTPHFSAFTFSVKSHLARFCYRFVGFLREAHPFYLTHISRICTYFLKKFTPYFCVFTFSVKNASTPHLLSESKVILIDFVIDLLDFCAQRAPSRSPLQRYIILANCASFFEKSGGAWRALSFGTAPCPSPPASCPHALALADL